MAKRGRPSKYSIYALCVDGEVMYVGQTINLQRRYKQHCSLSNNKSNNKRSNWMRSLIISGKLPELVVLEKTNEPDAAEIRWIKHYRGIGQASKNQADGGKTMSHANKAKQNKPWGSSWSPIHRRLTIIRETINIFKKNGNKEKEKYYSDLLIAINEFIKQQGEDKINNALWNKYGY